MSTIPTAWSRRESSGSVATRSTWGSRASCWGSSWCFPTGFSWPTWLRGSGCSTVRCSGKKPFCTGTTAGSTRRTAPAFDATFRWNCPRKRGGWGGRSVPVADPGVVRVRLALARLAERFQAHQEDRPLGAAVVHELHGLLPALVPEQHDGEIVFPLEFEVDLGADPLGGAVHYLPHHALVG